MTLLKKVQQRMIGIAEIESILKAYDSEDKNEIISELDKFKEETLWGEFYINQIKSNQIKSNENATSIY